MALLVRYPACDSGSDAREFAEDGRVSLLTRFRRSPIVGTYFTVVALMAVCFPANWEGSKSGAPLEE